jgi:hypothetical protein
MDTNTNSNGRPAFPLQSIGPESLYALPEGWSIKRKAVDHAVLHWGQEPRRAGREGRETIIPPRERLEFEIRFSAYGWMWADCYWRDSEHSGCAALEKWRHFAATPAAAALGAARDVLDRLREDNTTSRSGLAMRAAALELVATIIRAPMLDKGPQPLPAWPIAEQANHLAGYYRVAIVPEHAESVNEVIWWTGSRWLNVRPGCAVGACINRDRTEPLATWPRAMVWPLDVPVTPEDSRQFDAWAGADVEQSAAPQYMPVPTMRVATPQLDLFA